MRQALANQWHWQTWIAIGVFMFLSIWWGYIQISTASTDTLQHQIFAALYGVIALIGGIWGILISGKWGFYKSLVGRAILFFSLGLLTQEFGQLVYSYYIYFLKLDIPYPSLGDVGYFGSVILYILGAITLAKASGVIFRLKSLTHVIPALAVTFGLLGLGYYLFLQGYELDWSSPLRVFLDFGYPLGQAIYVSIAIATYILSKGILGGVMKSTILLIIVALSVQFLADYTFLYQASRETWYAGGFNDYIYLLSYFLMTIGLLRFGITYKNLKEGS